MVDQAAGKEKDPISKSCGSRLYRLNRLPDRPVESAEVRGRFPSWLHRPMPNALPIVETAGQVAKNRLHTVCEEAKCPNLVECYSRKTATFLLLGRVCTRACGFCEIAHAAAPPPPDPNEPLRLVESIKALGLRHVVLTMVARDDLADGGASHIAEAVGAIRSHLPEATCEVLVSDFMGKESSIAMVLAPHPEIFNHNLETVRRKTPAVRHKASYDRSLEVLSLAKKNGPKGMLTKSGLMLGLGETEKEVYEALEDLKKASVDIVTIGQYLQASQKKLSVHEFISPDRFELYQHYGRSLGIPVVYSGPFVRSSYNASLVIQHARSGAAKTVDS